MRVVVCMKHNALMESKAEGGTLLYCHMCTKRNDILGIPWFPLKLAYMNHKDGSTRRTWEAFRYWGPAHWRRVLNNKEEEFYVKLRNKVIDNKAATSFVCKPCSISAENGLHGKQNHEDAGCKGQQACDCQHREPNSRG